MHLQDKQVVETFEKYKWLFMKHRDRMNDVEDELQEAFLMFVKFLEKKSINDQWFAYELKNHIRGTKQRQKISNSRQRHISFNDIKLDYDVQSHHKTPEEQYEEKTVNEIYIRFKGSLSEIKVKVLDLLELHGNHAVKPFIEETNFSHTYFYRIKDQVHNEFKQYLRSNGYTV